MSNLCVIGVDGGGTSTKIALYCDLDSELVESLQCAYHVKNNNVQKTQTDDDVDDQESESESEEELCDFVGFRAVAGSTNWNSTGDTKAKENLFNLISSCLKDAEKQKQDVTHAVLGMSCVDTPADKEKLQMWMKEYFSSTSSCQPKVFVHGDAIIALSSGTQGVLDGIVNISGTGNIVYGRNIETQKEVRVSGFGDLLGDSLTNGYAIGLEILKNVMHSYDGRREKKTILTDLVLKHLNLKTPEDLIGWAYSSSSSEKQQEDDDNNDNDNNNSNDNGEWSKIASLAPLCFQAASSSSSPDEIAVEILDKTAKQIMFNIEVAARKLNYFESQKKESNNHIKQKSHHPHRKIVMSGSIAGSTAIFDRVKHLVSQNEKLKERFVVVRSSVAPEVAAAFLALRKKNDLESVKLL